MILTHSTRYTDGEIVRVGTNGPHGDGPYSSGRGGVANILSTSPDQKRKQTKRNDAEVVPELATRPEDATDHHIGRGGQGNVVHGHNGEKKGHPQGLADKLKDKLFGRKEKKAVHAEGKTVE